MIVTNLCNKPVQASMTAILFMFALTSFGCTVNGKQHSMLASSSRSKVSGLAGVQTRLRRMVPGDVRDDLYFAMLDRPYDRATLAIALRSSEALANDLKLRQHDAGSISKQNRKRATAWLERAVNRIGRDARSAPHSMGDTNWSDWVRNGSSSGDGPASVFAFVDRTKSREGSRRFGDFELVMSTGQPFYPVVSGGGAMVSGGASLQQYASSLDIPLVPIGSGAAQVASSGGSTLRSANLREIMTRSSGNFAVTDAAEGESWGAMMARRALVRGSNNSHTYSAFGISPPKGERQNLAERTRAAMWVQAIDGQRLGVVEGWRDATLAGGSTFPSRLADPEWLEAVAHTSMEIRKQSELLEPFRYERKMAVLIDASALDSRNPNAWSAKFTELVDALVDWQVPFDIVANNAAANMRYEYKLPFKPQAGFSADAAGKEASRLLSDRAPELRQVILFESDREPADDVYVRQSADAGWLAVVNLSGQSRSLKMLTPDGKTASKAYVDRLTSETVRRRIPLEPYGVRILARK